MGNDVYANAVGPTDMNPNAVVETTSAERRALDSSARLDMVDFGGGGSDVESLSLLLLFVASFASADSDAVKLLLRALISSSDDVVVEKNEL